MKFKISSIILLGLWSVQGYAQEGISTVGADLNNTGGSVSYTIGQPCYKVQSDGTSSITQGVQQPFEISVITDLDQRKAISLQLIAYPNPIRDYLQIKIEQGNYSNLTYKLFDLQGLLIQEDKIVEGEARLNAYDLVPSTYIVKVFAENREVKTFKIIKN